VLAPIHKIDIKYKSYLVISAKLQQIGISLNYYKNSEHSANFILHGLQYGFTHEERILISTILRYSTKELPTGKDIKEFKNLLPDVRILEWLSYIHSLNNILNSEYLRYNYEYSLIGDKFTISSAQKHYIIQKDILKLEKPIDFQFNLNLNGEIH